MRAVSHVLCATCIRRERSWDPHGMFGIYEWSSEAEAAGFAWPRVDAR